MYKYIIMGVQGCGKGTQAKMLAKDFDLSSHQRRGHLSLAHAEPHEAGARIGRITAAGELVPDDIVEEIVRGRLDQHDWNYGFILDGFPRIAGRRSFSGKLRYRRGHADRRRGPGRAGPRAQSAALRQVRPGLQPDFSPPGDPDICDVCGGKLSRAADDMPEAVKAAARLPQQDPADLGAVRTGRN